MKKKVIEIMVSTGKYSTFLNEFITLSDERKSSYVCVANVHMAIEAHKELSFRSIVNRADVTTPDGMPLAKAIKLLYAIDQDRVAGMDIMPDLMHLCHQKGKRIFLYGSTKDILEKIIEKAKVEFPNLQISAYSPPFRELTENEKNKIVSMINSYDPDFVFVALGCPKQEKWMAEHKGKINSCMIGLGGAFEVYAEVKTRAPKWMQNYSLEWLYRLMQDPKRLWKRYLYTNTYFVLLFIRQYITQKVFT